MNQEHSWWQTSVVYQVYPRSFMDASGDGTGDLKGIVSRLTYLEWLGVDALWLSPIFPSPMIDFGYDVADYTGVDEIFGTLEDFDALVAEAHGRGMKVILDYVPNHTSTEHPWFVEARSSRDNPKRDWYVWADPKPDGSRPNNWESHFDGPAWTFDETTGQYYLNSFDPEQADLNWRNPEVREAMYDAMRFWFERGVDGFRIDVLWLLIKDDELRDNPEDPDWKAGDAPWRRQVRVYSEDRPEVHEVVREMRSVAEEYDERVLIGEIYLPVDRLLTYYGEDLSGVHLPFNFQLLLIPEWDAAEVRRLVDEYEAALPIGAWPNWVLGNHDNPRIAGRVGRERSRLAQMLLLTLRGTPTCYYGDEIGMEDVDVPPHLVADPPAKNNPDFGRDPERTPMQWDASPNAGFCPPGVEPWLPLADDYEKVNVEAQREDPSSMLNLVRSLLALRRETPALTTGSYRSLDSGSREVFAFLRENEDQRVLVALNFGEAPQYLDLSEAGETARLLCSTVPDRDGHIDPTQLKLRPHEGIVALLER